jgi:hypothetical protein
MHLNTTKTLVELSVDRCHSGLARGFPLVYPVFRFVYWTLYWLHSRRLRVFIVDISVAAFYVP